MTPCRLRAAGNPHVTPSGAGKNLRKPKENNGEK